MNNYKSLIGKATELRAIFATKDEENIVKFLVEHGVKMSSARGLSGVVAQASEIIIEEQPSGELTFKATI
jgi:hypothetical protein